MCSSFVEGRRTAFDPIGDFMGLGTLWALVWTDILVAAGLWTGTCTFRRQNA